MRPFGLERPGKALEPEPSSKLKLPQGAVPRLIAERAQLLITACERLISGVGPKPTSGGLFARLVARLSTPIGLVMHGVMTMGVTFYGWLAVLLSLFLLQRSAINLEVFDVRTIEQVSGALMIYFTIAIALTSPSHVAKPGYSSANLLAALSAVGEQLPELDEDTAFIRQHLYRGEEALKWRVTSLRWAAGVLFGLAAYIAQKGLDRGDGNLLGTAMLPLFGAAAIGLCLSAYERGVRSTYNLAHAVLHGRLSATRTLPKLRKVRRRIRAG